MTRFAAPSLLSDETRAEENIAGRRAGRPVGLRVFALEMLEQFLGPPTGMTAPRLKNREAERLRRLIRRGERPARPVGQTGGAFRLIAIDPFVAGLAADAVSVAEFRERNGVAEKFGDKLSF